MKWTLLVIGLLYSIGAYSQDLPHVSYQYERTPAIEVMADLSDRSGFVFYYAPEWVDSLSITASMDDAPLDEALLRIVEPLGIHFFIGQGEVILTKGVKIIDNPQLLESLYEDRDSLSATRESDRKKTMELQKGLIFSRDFSGAGKNSKGIEHKVVEIGLRDKFSKDKKSTIVGYVREEGSGEPIVGGAVYSKKPAVNAATDGRGFFSIALPNGKRTLHFQHMGMKPTKREIVLFSDGKLNVPMKEDIITLSGLTVAADRDANVREVKMGVTNISAKETKNVPIVFGEKDIMKIATTMAGVQTSGEGASGFHVRGGKSDQNLILLNGATIYNANHFFGFFSVFNSEAIQGMELYKSSIPARFGGRLSAVFDIESKRPNKEKFRGSAALSPITSKLTLEVPIIKEKAALMVAGRATYSNWILKRLDNANFNRNRASFSDLILRYDHKIDAKNELVLSGYLSKDKFTLTSDSLFSFSDFSYANANAALKWNKRFNAHLEGSLSTYHTSYGYDLSFDESAANAFTQDFGIRETGMKADLNYYKMEAHEISMGLGTNFFTVNPGTQLPFGPKSLVAPLEIQKTNGLESSLYIEDQYAINSALGIAAGLRYSFFQALGEREVFEYAPGIPKSEDSRIGSTFFDAGETIELYHGPEYRFSMRYAFNQSESIKVGINRNRQYLHTLSNSASLSPTDTWALSGAHLKPQIADQVSLGYYKNLLDAHIELSWEAYYKKLQNLVDFKVGADFLLNERIEAVALQGKGKSYGLEFSLKKSGDLNGWLNYTYARTFIRLDGAFPEETINGGAFYPTNYDRPHTINLVTNYKFTKRISLSSNVQYSTGRPVTYPVGAYNFKGAQVIHYGDRNSFRIPDYFRLDLGFSLEEGHRTEKFTHSYWSLSIYNLIGRDNPFSIFFDASSGEVEGFKLVVFGTPIPTLSFNFRF